MAKKSDRAAQFLHEAKEFGHVATLEGRWVVFRPPLPVDMLMESSDLADEIAKLVKAEGHHQ